MGLGVGIFGVVNAWASINWATRQCYKPSSQLEHSFNWDRGLGTCILNLGYQVQSFAGTRHFSHPVLWIAALTIRIFLLVNKPLNCWRWWKNIFIFDRWMDVNTLRPKQNGRHFADEICKCILLNGNFWILNEISLRYVPQALIKTMGALVQIMAWHLLVDKPCIEPMMVSLLTYTRTTRLFNEKMTDTRMLNVNLWNFD